MFRSLPLSDVRLKDPIFAPRIAALARGGLSHQYRMIVETGRLENFRRVARGERGSHQGRRYDDSDVYKWLEACAYSLAHLPADPLQSEAEEAIAAILAAQAPDGYLDTYIQLEEPEERFTKLAESHEVYCLGHLIEAAVAWRDALGDGRLLQGARQAADLLERTLGAGGIADSDGHPEIELALHRLADATGEARYRALADRMLDRRGTRPSAFEAEFDRLKAAGPLPWGYALSQKDGRYDGSYIQDHAPIREQPSIEGHAVRAAYLYAGAAASLRRRDDADLLGALRRLWENTTGRRMYITGGIGSSHSNEGFTSDYDLPNRSAYAETCASIALALWGREMGEVTGESEYADVVERALLNGVLAGISPEGERYFYANPLESRGEHARVPWFDCACCPPNAARTIGRVTDFALAVSSDSLRVDLPLAGEYKLEGFGNLTISGTYPLSGEAQITLDLARPLTLRLRIPDWAEEFELDAPDELGAADYDRGYALLPVPAGTTEIRLVAPMRTVAFAAHPSVLDDAGRVALMHGPTVLAAIGDLDAEVRLERHALDLDAEPIGATRYEIGPGDDALYAPAESGFAEGRVEFVPYRDWANDGPRDMAVWMRRA